MVYFGLLKRLSVASTSIALTFLLIFLVGFSKAEGPSQKSYVLNKESQADGSTVYRTSKYGAIRVAAGSSLSGMGIERLIRGIEQGALAAAQQDPSRLKQIYPLLEAIVAEALNRHAADAVAIWKSPDATLEEKQTKDRLILKELRNAQDLLKVARQVTRTIEAFGLEYVHIEHPELSYPNILRPYRHKAIVSAFIGDSTALPEKFRNSEEEFELKFAPWKVAQVLRAKIARGELEFVPVGELGGRTKRPKGGINPMNLIRLGNGRIEILRMLIEEIKNPTEPAMGPDSFLLPDTTVKGQGEVGAVSSTGRSKSKLGAPQKDSFSTDLAVPNATAGSTPLADSFGSMNGPFGTDSGGLEEKVSVGSDGFGPVPDAHASAGTAPLSEVTSVGSESSSSVPKADGETEHVTTSSAVTTGEQGAIASTEEGSPDSGKEGDATGLNISKGGATGVKGSGGATDVKSSGSHTGDQSDGSSGKKVESEGSQEADFENPGDSDGDGIEDTNFAGEDSNGNGETDYNQDSEDSCQGQSCGGSGGLTNPEDDSGGCDACGDLSQGDLVGRISDLVSLISTQQSFHLLDFVADWDSSGGEERPSGPGRGLLDALSGLLGSDFGTEGGHSKRSVLSLADLVADWGNGGGVDGGDGPGPSGPIGDRSELVANEVDTDGNSVGPKGPPNSKDRSERSPRQWATNMDTGTRVTGSQTGQGGSGSVTVTARRPAARQAPTVAVPRTQKAAVQQVPGATSNGTSMPQSQTPATKLQGLSDDAAQAQSPGSEAGYRE